MRQLLLVFINVLRNNRFQLLLPLLRVGGGGEIDLVSFGERLDLVEDFGDPGGEDGEILGWVLFLEDGECFETQSAVMEEIQALFECFDAVPEDLVCYFEDSFLFRDLMLFQLLISRGGNKTMGWSMR